MSLNIFVSPDDDIGMKEGHSLINVMANLVNHLDHTKVIMIVSTPITLLSLSRHTIVLPYW